MLVARPGIDLTLTFLRAKRDETRRLARVAPVDLGIPQLACITRGPAVADGRNSAPRDRADHPRNPG